MNLNETKAIVTGGASGMGRHFVARMVQSGAAVAAADVDAAGLTSLAAELDGAPGTIRTFEADVSSEEQVVALVNGACEALGGLNCLVNNAGIFRDRLLVKPDKGTGIIRKMSLREWEAVIAVDLTGPFLCTRELAAKVIETGTRPAVVVNISSVSRAGNPGQGNYSAAKAGLVADTRVWARELARYGIRVGAIAPGFVDTPILSAMRPEMLEMMLKNVPLGRLGSCEEIYQGIEFIIRCEYFTGRCLDIDGGVTM